MKTMIVAIAITGMMYAGSMTSQTRSASPPSGRQQPSQRLEQLLKLSQARVKVNPKIDLPGAPPATSDPTIRQALQEQREQAHLDKVSLHTGTPATPGHAMAAPIRNRPGATVPQHISLQNPCLIQASSAPVIQSVSGKTKGIVFTPDPGIGPNPQNQYSIKGCNFGAVQGQGEVHVFGGFLNHSGPVKLAIDSWSDNLIIATFNPAFQDEYDLRNLTVVVVAANGQSASLSGNSFYAARASRPLKQIPQPSISDHVDKSYFLSPPTPQNEKIAGVGLPSAMPSTTSGYAWQGASIWHDYPPRRITWHEQIDFSRLRSGFTVDNSLQSLSVNYSDIESCKYGETNVIARMQGRQMLLDVQPAECDAGGKWAIAAFGLILSVTGPKGDKLSPW